VIDGCMTLVSRVDIERGVVILTQGSVILTSKGSVTIATPTAKLNL
jgi:hypothetical protein